AANALEPFRLRIRGEGVWLHDIVGISTTVPRTDDTFGYAVYEMARSFADFEPKAREVTEQQKNSSRLLTPAEGQDDLIYHSTIPWIRFTAVTNAIGENDSIPRIVFGRAVEEGGRHVMPVAVEVHHALIDGLDVARFFEKFQHALAGFGKRP